MACSRAPELFNTAKDSYISPELKDLVQRAVDIHYQTESAGSLKGYPILCQSCNGSILATGINPVHLTATANLHHSPPTVSVELFPYSTFRCQACTSRPLSAGPGSAQRQVTARQGAAGTARAGPSAPSPLMAQIRLAAAPSVPQRHPTVSAGSESVSTHHAPPPPLGGGDVAQMRPGIEVVRGAFVATPSALTGKLVFGSVYSVACASCAPTVLRSPADTASWLEAHSGHVSPGASAQVAELSYDGQPAEKELAMLAQVVLMISNWILLYKAPEEVAKLLLDWATLVREDPVLNDQALMGRPSLQADMRCPAPGCPRCPLLEVVNAAPYTYSVSWVMRFHDKPGHDRKGEALPSQRLAALVKSKHKGKLDWETADPAKAQGAARRVLRDLLKDDPRHSGSPERFLDTLGITLEELCAVLAMPEVDSNIAWCASCGAVGSLFACDGCVDAYCDQCCGVVETDMWFCKYCERRKLASSRRLAAEAAAAAHMAGLGHDAKAQAAEKPIAHQQPPRAQKQLAAAAAGPAPKAGVAAVGLQFLRLLAGGSRPNAPGTQRQTRGAAAAGAGPSAAAAEAAAAVVAAVAAAASQPAAGSAQTVTIASPGLGEAPLAPGSNRRKQACPQPIQNRPPAPGSWEFQQALMRSGNVGLGEEAEETAGSEDANEAAAAGSEAVDRRLDRELAAAAAAHDAAAAEAAPGSAGTGIASRTRRQSGQAAPAPVLAVGTRRRRSAAVAAAAAAGTGGRRAAVLGTSSPEDSMDLESDQGAEPQTSTPSTSLVVSEAVKRTAEEDVEDAETSEDVVVGAAGQQRLSGGAAAGGARGGAKPATGAKRTRHAAARMYADTFGDLESDGVEVMERSRSDGEQAPAKGIGRRGRPPSAPRGGAHGVGGRRGGRGAKRGATGEEEGDEPAAKRGRGGGGRARSSLEQGAAPGGAGGGKEGHSPAQGGARGALRGELALGSPPGHDDNAAAEVLVALSHGEQAAGPGPMPWQEQAAAGGAGAAAGEVSGGEAVGPAGALLQQQTAAVATKGARLVSDFFPTNPPTAGKAARGPPSQGAEAPPPAAAGRKPAAQSSPAAAPAPRPSPQAARRSAATAGAVTLQGRRMSGHATSAGAAAGGGVAGQEPMSVAEAIEFMLGLMERANEWDVEQATINNFTRVVGDLLKLNGQYGCERVPSIVTSCLRCLDRSASGEELEDAMGSMLSALQAVLAQLSAPGALPALESNGHVSRKDAAV